MQMVESVHIGGPNTDSHKRGVHDIFFVEVSANEKGETTGAVPKRRCPDANIVHRSN